MKEYIVSRYVTGGSIYFIIPESEVIDTEKRDAIELPERDVIELPEGVSGEIKKKLLEILNDKTVSKTVYQEIKEIKVSEGHGPDEIANWKVIFGNISKKLTYPNSTPNPDKRWRYVHYTLTPADNKGVIAIETVSRISGPYTNIKIFVISSMENNESNQIHE